MNGVLYLISHQGGNRSSNFMILWSFTQRAQQDEKKPTAQRTRGWNICGILRSVFCSNTYYLVVMGTSARPFSSTAGARRTNATTGRSRNSSSPTRTLEASAPGGIFFMKWRSIWETCTKRLRFDVNTGSVCFFFYYFFYSKPSK